jgi:uncharacterized membrane protein
MFRSLRKTFIAGIFFLAPVIVLIMIALKALELLQKLLHPILNNIPDITIMGGIALHETIAFTVLIIICLLAGLFARTYMAKQFINNIENNLLNRIPGYALMKAAGEDFVGTDNPNLHVVMAWIEESWQYAIIIEVFDETRTVIFIPDSPSTKSGAVHIIDNTRIKSTELTYKQLMRLMAEMGKGSSEHLKELAKDIKTD